MFEMGGGGKEQNWKIEGKWKGRGRRITRVFVLFGEEKKMMKLVDLFMDFMESLRRHFHSYRGS